MIEQFDLIESLRLKDQGMQAAANSCGASEWLSQAREVGKLISALCGEVSSDDILRQCPKPLSVSHQAIGSLFKGKGWRLLGYTKTQKISGHA